MLTKHYVTQALSLNLKKMLELSYLMVRHYQPRFQSLSSLPPFNDN